MSEKPTSSGGVSGLCLLGIVFVTLKLCGVIDWSWWWVTLPFWWTLAAAAAAILICGIFLWVSKYNAQRKD